MFRRCFGSSSRPSRMTSVSLPLVCSMCCEMFVVQAFIVFIDIHVVNEIHDTFCILHSSIPQPQKHYYMSTVGIALPLPTSCIFPRIGLFCPHLGHLRLRHSVVSPFFSIQNILYFDRILCFKDLVHISM